MLRRCLPGVIKSRVIPGCANRLFFNSLSKRVPELLTELLTKLAVVEALILRARVFDLQ